MTGKGATRGACTAKIGCMSDATRDTVEWARAAPCEPLPADLVPGTSSSERRSLAALGGLVGALVAPVPADWPEAIQQWVRSGPRPPAALVESVWNANADGERDLFADVYEQLVVGQNRRRLGTFFTPPNVVDLMLRRVADVLPSPAQVVDPGAGVGAFSLASRRRWPQANVVAVDVNIVTLGLLAARAHPTGTAELTVVHTDFLGWIGGRSHAGPTVLLGNPPYTRHQDLDQKLKAVAMEASGGLVDSGLAGLAAYFLGASLRSLRDEDGLCFVLPGSWTESRYGRPIREWLWVNSHRRTELLSFSTSAEVFPGTRVTAMVLVVGPVEASASPMRVERVSVKGNEIGVLGVDEHYRNGPAPRSFGPLLWPRRTASRKSTVALSDIATVRRGVATGANHFFFLTDDEADALPNSVVVAGLRRLRHVDGDELNKKEHDRIGDAGHPRWLLSLKGPSDIKSAAVRRRLAEGVAAGYDDRYLSRDRDPWYAVETVKPPSLLVALMTKDRFRAVLNTARVVPSNSIYGIYVNRAAQARALCDWINSDEGQDALRAQARHYSNGLFKLEPRDYLRVRVPSVVAHGVNRID